VTLLIDSYSPNWVAVNSEGEEILNLCDGSRTAREIASSTDLKYSRAEVYRFLEEAAQSEIIGSRPASIESYTGRAAVFENEPLEELWIYVTNRCNLACKHCLVRGGENDKDELSIGELKGIIEKGLTLGLKRVFFTGGEPFLRSDIFNLIELVTRKLNLELVILTNGTLLDGGMLEKLASYPRLAVQVSIEGPEAEINDEIRGKRSYRKAMKSVELLIELGVRTIVTSTVTKNNIAKIPALSDLLYKKGVKTHHILWLHNRGRARQNRISVNADSISSLMRTLKNREIKIDNWESFNARINGRHGQKIDGCHGGISSLCIDSDGGVYPCPSVAGDDDFFMGNVASGLEKVWRGSKAVVEMRNASVFDIKGCRTCEFRFFCGGGCRCQAYYGGEEANILAKDPYCSVIKGMLVENMFSQLSPNGHGTPELLGSMKKTTLTCEDGSSSPKGVTQFRCTCVLDVATKHYGMVETRYGEAAAKKQEDLCCPTGYSEADLNGLPENTIAISYGCGNPTAFADLKEGERVLDLGSGGGIDGFIAAKKVGKTGRVIGVDMTEEMLNSANKNAEKMAALLGYDIVEFRKGLLENLPVESGSIDLVMSNCVINLSPDKVRAFTEIFRVLKSGGRFSISDIVSDKEVPEEMKKDEDLWSGCISGALTKDEFLRTIKDAGFFDVTIENSNKWKDVSGIEFYSMTVRGMKG
jgi:radical SAM protein with 4Fe4S-binding SPASM domain